jgi:hypothetical protein
MRDYHINIFYSENGIVTDLEAAGIPKSDIANVKDFSKIPNLLTENWTL